MSPETNFDMPPFDKLHERLDQVQLDVAELRADNRTIQAGIKTLADTMDKMAEALVKLAVLETKHVEQGKALGRCFDEIQIIKSDQTIYASKNDEKHSKYETWLAFTAGAAAAVSILWTVFGYYISDTVRETVKTVAVVKQHIDNDRIHVLKGKANEN